MLPILLFAGILVLLIGLAAYGGQEAASAGRLRSHSRTYALASIVGGTVLIIVAIGAIALR